MKKVKEGQSTKPHSQHCSPSPPTTPMPSEMLQQLRCYCCGVSTREKVIKFSVWHKRKSGFLGDTDCDFHITQV